MISNLRLVLPFIGLATKALGAPTADLPIVDLGYQRHQAYSFQEDVQLYNFSNIPYAEPPTGSLRFKAPEPPSWTKHAVQRGDVRKVCPQGIPKWQGVLPVAGADDPDITEDCLVLDVVVPKNVFHSPKHTRHHKGAPVLVWIYGGGYTFGTKDLYGSPNGIIAASQADGSPGIIWVAMNYRLGAFGWLGGPSLQSDGTANAGFHDQRLALEWIRDNIAKFGGDPDNVTIMGESAGGSSVIHQMSAYGGKKDVAFRRGIAQSPGYFPVTAKKAQESQFQKFLDRLNISSVEEARQLPSSTLVEASLYMIETAPWGTYEFGPVVDNDFIPADAAQLFLEDRYATHVRVMSAFNADEGAMFNDPTVTNETRFNERARGFYTELSDKDFHYLVSTLYPPIYDGSKGYTSISERYNTLFSDYGFACNHNVLMNSALKHHHKSFGYHFSVPPAIHGSDLPYTFFPSNGPVASNETAHLMQAYIANFAKIGDPNGVGNDTELPEYGHHHLMLDFNSTQTVITDPSQNERCAFRQRAF